MVIKSSLIALFVSLSAWSSEPDLAGVSSYLSSLEPYSVNLRTTRNVETCRSVGGRVPQGQERPRECTNRVEEIPNTALINRLKRDILNQPGLSAFRRSCRSNQSLSPQGRRLCLQLNGLDRFINVFESLEACAESSGQLTDQLDRAIGATDLSITSSTSRCVDALSAAMPVPSDVLSNLSRVVTNEETVEFGEMADFLINDSTNESMRAHELYSHLYGQTENRSVSQTSVDDFCHISKNSSALQVATGIFRFDDVCNQSDRRRLQSTLESHRPVRTSLTPASVQASLNQKVQRLNELNELHSEKVADLHRRYNARRREIDERVLARTGGNIRGMISGGLAALKKEFEDARQTILADIQTQGADELALMPSLQAHFNREPGDEVPPLTPEHIAVALSEARSKSSLQLRKLSQMRTDLRERSQNRGSRLNYNDLKGDLMRLVRSNPISVGRMLASNSEYTDNLCQVNRTMRTNQMIDQFWDTSFLVVGVGVGVASIIATGGASTPLVLAAAGTVSIGLAATEISVSQLRINESARRQDEIIAAVLAGLGDDASYEDLQVAVGQERSARFHRNLAIVLAPLEAFSVADIARAAARAPAAVPRPVAVPTQRATPAPAPAPTPSAAVTGAPSLPRTIDPVPPQFQNSSTKNMADAMHRDYVSRNIATRPLNEKPVPLQPGETAEQALARYNREGFNGLRINENGVLVQNIMQDPNLIVPSLHADLNGRAALAYAPIVDEIGVDPSADSLARASQQVHDEWIRLESWRAGSNDAATREEYALLSRPFDELSAAEQIKDLDQLETLWRLQNPNRDLPTSFGEARQRILQSPSPSATSASLSARIDAIPELQSLEHVTSGHYD